RHTAGPDGAGVPSRRAVMVREDQAPCKSSTQTSLLELAVDAVGELVEPLVDADLLGDHLLQRGRPFGGEIEEQRLRGKIDFCAGRRDIVLLEIARIGLCDAVAELA